MEKKMLLTVEQVKKLNALAQVNFEAAKAALDIANSVLGTKYGWLAKEVVWFENPDASTAEKYAHAHSAIAWAEWGK